MCVRAWLARTKLIFRYVQVYRRCYDALSERHYYWNKDRSIGSYVKPLATTLPSLHLELSKPADLSAAAMNWPISKSMCFCCVNLPCMVELICSCFVAVCDSVAENSSNSVCACVQGLALLQSWYAGDVSSLGRSRWCDWRAEAPVFLRALLSQLPRSGHSLSFTGS